MDLNELYDDLINDAGVRSKFLADQIKFLEDQGVTVTDDVKANACLRNEQDILDFAQKAKQRSQNRIAGMYVL